MKQTDLYVAKEQEVKRLNDQVLNLTEKINNLNILVGSKDELIKSKEKELQKELELVKDQSKVIIETPSGTTTYRCERCGHITTEFRNWCPKCDNKMIQKVTPKVTYKNLDTELVEIKKTIEKQMKKSVADLENTQLDLEIKIEGLEKELERKQKIYNSEVSDLQDKNMKRITKIREECNEKVDELTEELRKTKKHQTEEELEAKRKVEILELKTANELLTKKLIAAEKTGFIHRLINKLFDLSLRKQALKEVLEASNLNQKIADTKEYAYRRGNRGAYEYKTPYGTITCSNVTNPYYLS